MTHRPYRALVVDDSRSLRRLVRLMIEDGANFNVVGEADDGRPAIEMARALSPDLILLDLAMPRMGGLDALPRLQGAAPDAKIVILSVLEDAQLRQAAADAGAVAYLVKGASPAELVESLLTALEESPQPPQADSAGVDPR